MLKTAAFLVMVLAQVALLGIAPVRDRRVMRAGERITLRAVMSDRHNLLHGGYVNLKYDAGTPPGLAELNAKPGDEVYVVGHTGEDGVWVATKVSAVYPADKSASEQTIRGRLAVAPDGAWRVEFGLERIYLPDAVQQAFKLRLPVDNKEVALDLAVDSEGRWSFVGVRAGDAYYEK